MRQIFRRKDQSIALPEILPYLRDEDSVIPQIPAFVHQSCVVTIVDVEHHSGALQCGEDVLLHVRVRELEDRTVRFIRCPIVKDYILGCGKTDLFPAVNTDILCFHIALIQTAEIKQSSQGEIGALGTVVLIILLLLRSFIISIIKNDAVMARVIKGSALEKIQIIHN